jgi:hypothetical protein
VCESKQKQPSKAPVDKARKPPDYAYNAVILERILNKNAKGFKAFSVFV